MKRLLKFFTAILVIALATLIIMAVVKDNHYRIEESIVIDAPSDKVFPTFADLHNWEAWSPWRRRDPSIHNTYEGPEIGVGSQSSWTSKRSGSGKIIVTEYVPLQRIRFRLVFIEWNSESSGEINVTPEGNSTKVTWITEGTRGFMEKVFTILFRMDKAMKRDFTRGLTYMKENVEHVATP